jgi:hypothetical protein
LSEGYAFVHPSPPPSGGKLLSPSPPPPPPEGPGSVMGGGDRAKCVNIRVKELMGTYILKVMAACQGILFMNDYLIYKIVQVICLHMYIYMYKGSGRQDVKRLFIDSVIQNWVVLRYA